MKEYLNPGPTQEEIDSSSGSLVLEFGSNFCGYCHAAEPLIEEALSKFPSVAHVKVEDGPKRRLGRSFKVQLWPTLIFLKDGKEIAREVRPTSVNLIENGLKLLVQ